MNNQYLFELGKHPALSIAEIDAVLSLWNIKYKTVFQNKTYFILETKKPMNEQKLMNRLGGTIKIQQSCIVYHVSHINEVIINYLKNTLPNGKIEFSLTGVGAKKLALEIKKELKSYGRSVRYIEPKNTATILHNKLVEKQTDLTIFNGKLFVTKAIQPIEEFGKRDYGRPGFDPKSGMLPPKLAKIMINLAQAKQNATILDPFCGSGTILMEAALMDYKNLIGSDISDKAINDTKQNIDWIRKTYHLLSIIYHVYKQNITDLHKTLKPHKIDTIITEPYLGKPLKGNETRKQLEKQTQELKQLYIDAFKSFHKILKPNGTVVIIIPKFKFKNSWIEIDCLSEIKKAGFKPVALSKKSPSLLYHRKNQHVGREIWKFVKICQESI